MDQKTTCNDWAVASSGGSWKAQARNWRLTTRQLELSRVWIPGTYQFSPALSSIPVSTVATAGQRPVDWRNGRGSSRAGAQAMWLVARACKDAAGPQLWLKLARECGSARWLRTCLGETFSQSSGRNFNVADDTTGVRLQIDWSWSKEVVILSESPISTSRRPRPFSSLFRDFGL